MLLTKKFLVYFFNFVPYKISASRFYNFKYAMCMFKTYVLVLL